MSWKKVDHDTKRQLIEADQFGCNVLLVVRFEISEVECYDSVTIAGWQDNWLVPVDSQYAPVPVNGDLHLAPWAREECLGYRAMYWDVLPEPPEEEVSPAAGAERR